ncbi:MAG: GntR family transcriptional regulator [Verrucomicrobiae bacterium]|nr:GntR family transcriptional regulator [Verrucomicrobiae bacterium]
MISPPTKQQAVYRHLRGQIMKARLRPGQRLVIDDIAREQGISAIPVREAIKLLEAEHLVDCIPHAGARVTSVTPQNVLETFLILENLEAVAVSQLTPVYTDVLHEELSSLVRKMDDSLGKDDPESWSRLNIEFHRTMAKQTGMPMLLEMTERALDCWDRIRLLYFKNQMTGHLTRPQSEHHALIKALSKRDSARADVLIRRHNQSALKFCLSLIDKKANTTPPALP